MTRSELDAVLRDDPHSAEGLASSAWEPLHRWTDAELGELDEQFEDTPFATSEARTAEQVITQEAASRAKNLQDMQRYFAHHDLVVDHSIGGLVELMVACRILTSDDSGRLSVNEMAPLPAEVLPLDPQEEATQDELRWGKIHQGTAQAVIQLFEPDEQTVEVLPTSISDLAQRLERAPESIRSGLSVLLSEGDFTASSDVEVVEEDHSFNLRVDWEQFNQIRMSLRFATDERE